MTKNPKRNKTCKSVFKKILKFISYCILLFGLWFQTKRFYTKLKITPEIFTKENFVKTRTIPFPAVTICPNYFLKENQAPEFVENRNLTNDVIDLLCTYLMPDGNNSDEKEKEIFDNLKKFSPKFNDSIDSAFYSEVLLNSKNFSISYTEYGICYTFNSLRYNAILKNDVISGWKTTEKQINSDWTLNNDYSTRKDLVYPVRASPYQNLDFNFRKIQQHKEFCMLKPNHMIFKVHLPNELPTSISSTFKETFDEYKALLISAEIRHTDISLKGLSLKQRGCYYEHEKQLRFFKAYTKLNCEYECLINLTYAKHQCVPFLFPRGKEMEVCRKNSGLNIVSLMENWPEVYYRNQKNPHLLPVYPCDCMEPCKRVNYKIVKEFIVDKVNRIYKVKFIDAQILLSTTYITYQLENFIFDVAGLFGLFLGSSIASMFLIPLKLYKYLKIVWLKFYQKRQQNQEVSGDSEIKNEQLGRNVVSSEDEIDRPQSALSEISRNVFILSSKNAPVITVPSVH